MAQRRTRRSVAQVAFGLCLACSDDVSKPRVIAVSTGRDVSMPIGAAEDRARSAEDAPAPDQTASDAAELGLAPDAVADGVIADAIADGAFDLEADADAGPVPDAAPFPDAASAPDRPLPDGPPPTVCGNAVVEIGETCDDGSPAVIALGCALAHDGGDGVCVGLGQCRPDFALLANGTCGPADFGTDVDIFVDNFCNMRVVPPELHVAPGRFVSITWHNRSVDYPVDVWLSYGGGFLDLEPGTVWADRFDFCHGDRPYRAGADISTACSEWPFVIYCD